MFKDFKTMITAQEELNNKYVPNWREAVYMEQQLSAVLTELAEWFESAPQFWKWWKLRKTNSYWEYEELLYVFKLQFKEENIEVTKISEDCLETILNDFEAKTDKEKYSILLGFEEFFK